MPHKCTSHLGLGLDLEGPVQSGPPELATEELKTAYLGILGGLQDEVKALILDALGLDPNNGEGISSQEDNASGLGRGTCWTQRRRKTR